MYKKTSFIILAAGKGSRMKSSLPKVLHKVNNRTMIDSVVQSIKKITDDNIIAVIGHEAELLKSEIKKKEYNIDIAIQEKLDGTASAVRSAIPYLKNETQNVVVLCGDSPFITSASLKNLIKKHIEDNNKVTVIAAKTDNPFGYGRVIQGENDTIVGIVEEKDATDEEKKIKIVNTGVYCIQKDFLEKALTKIKPNNVQKEFYLTDIVRIAHNQEEKLGVFVAKNFFEFFSINTAEELKEAEKIGKK